MSWAHKSKQDTAVVHTRRSTMRTTMHPNYGLVCNLLMLNLFWCFLQWKILVARVKKGEFGKRITCTT